MKIRIREGNDFDVVWAITRAGQPDDLSTAINMKLTLVVYGLVIEHSLFTVTDNMLSINIPKEVATTKGDYRLVFEYTLPDAGQPDGDLKCKTDVVPFRIVPFSADADDVYTVNTSSDVLLGFKGDKGDDGDDAYQIWLDLGNVGTYEDFIAYLRQPAVDAGASISELEGEIQVSEGLRVSAETARVNAEGDATKGRVKAENERVQAETARAAAETARVNAEGDATKGRVKAENERVAAEGERAAAETARVNAEGDETKGRVKAENERVTAEGERAAAETARANAEGDATKGRVKAENERVAAEGERAAAETARANAEGDATKGRVKAENERVAAEGERAQAFAQMMGEADDKIGEMDTTLSTYEGRMSQAESDISQLAGEVSLLDAVQGAKIKDIENVLSTANLGQSAQLSVSGRKIVSLPKNASNGGMSVKLEGLTAENLVVNGDFRNGTTGWTPHVSSQLVLTSTALQVTNKTASYNICQAKADTFSAIVGNYYYIKCKVRVLDNVCQSIVFNRPNSSFTIVNNPVQNQWYDVAGVKIANFSDGLWLTASYADGATAFGKTLEIDRIYGVVTINLTQTFGSGNEPDLATCDAMFSSYFEGRKNFEATGMVRSVDKNGLNPTALYLTAPELRSNGTVKDEIRKGANGYELVKRISDVDGTVLATPVISPISFGGILNSAENGTVYHEPVIADAGVYGTNMSILLTDYPINTLEEIIVHKNGIDTYLDVSTAVIAGDKLSFTHPSLQSGDLVLFTYSFAKESTNGNITATFYDSNVVKIDTVTGKAYKITDVVTNGVLTRTLTEV